MTNHGNDETEDFVFICPRCKIVLKRVGKTFLKPYVSYFCPKCKSESLALK